VNAELVVKIAICAGGGLGVARALHLPYPEYAVLAAATVVDTGAREAGLLGILRMVGTVVGAGLAVLVVHVAGVEPWSVALAAGIGMTACILVHSSAAARLSVIVLGVGAIGFADRVDSWLGDRLLTTLVGVLLSVGVSAVPWPARAAARVGVPVRRLAHAAERRGLALLPETQLRRLTRAGIVSEE
jgi:uncharacterized membrane protein YgaE (UPF0421/DUF939 family)